MINKGRIVIMEGIDSDKRITLTAKILVKQKYQNKEILEEGNFKANLSYKIK